MEPDVSSLPELSADDCRVLGVLIEKAFTTPAQYPLSLNAVTLGCSQKNNREPVVEYDEDRAMAALNRLRGHGMCVLVDQAGSRVFKYRHEAGAKLGIGATELAVIGELLLRGPQTVGEIRNRASRMKPLDTLDAAQAVLDDLMRMTPPLVRRVAPAPGSRAERFIQLLCPEAHPLNVASSGGRDIPPVTAPSASVAAEIAQLKARIAGLEARQSSLIAYLTDLADKLGESPPVPPEGPLEGLPESTTVPAGDE